MKQYTDLIERILKEGHQSDDRTGTGTVKIFGHQSTYNMDDGFPLLTLKKTWMPGVTHELLWLLGNHTKLDGYKDLPMTNIKYMVDNKVHIWDEWADENGDLGPVYGKQWVKWGDIGKLRMKDTDGNHYYSEYKQVNQIQTVADKLTEGHENFSPMDRGLVVSAWNVGELDDMALRPCHAFFQFQARELSHDERVKEEYQIRARKAGPGKFVSPGVFTSEPGPSVESLDSLGVPKYELSLQLYQRSADTFLGVPFNIASYSLLLHMVCHVTNMKPGKFVHSFGDAHLYSNHKDQVNTLLSRTNVYGGRGQVETKGWEDLNIMDYWGSKGELKTGHYNGPQLPTLWLNPEIKNIFDFTYDDIEIVDYNPLPTIKAEVSV